MESQYEFDSKKFCLGSLCKRGHTWPGTEQSLRRLCPSGGRGCVECERARLLKSGAAYMRQYRALHGRPSRSKYSVEEKELQQLRRNIYKISCSPTVPQLVMQAQQLYWQEHPEEKRRHDKERARASWRLKYQTNPDLRLYHREKKHRRKAKERGQTPLQVSVAALRQRFNEFSNCCAYCGQEGDMQIEHVEPISEGGLHDIGNIVPACLSCNYSKRTSEMEFWYRQQPFFSELRLQAIRRVVRQPEGAQLALALA